MGCVVVLCWFLKATQILVGIPWKENDTWTFCDLQYFVMVRSLLVLNFGIYHVWNNLGVVSWFIGRLFTIG